MRINDNRGLARMSPQGHPFMASQVAQGVGVRKPPGFKQCAAGLTLIPAVLHQEPAAGGQMGGGGGNDDAEVIQPGRSGGEGRTGFEAQIAPASNGDRRPPHRAGWQRSCRIFLHLVQHTSRWRDSAGCAAPRRRALACATASAAADASTATTSAMGRCRARVMATAPLPVPRSRMRHGLSSGSVPGRLQPAVRFPGAGSAPPG